MGAIIVLTPAAHRALDKHFEFGKHYGKEGKMIPLGTKRADLDKLSAKAEKARAYAMKNNVGIRENGDGTFTDLESGQIILF